MVANEKNDIIYLFKNTYLVRYLQTVNVVKAKAYIFLNSQKLKKR